MKLDPDIPLTTLAPCGMSCHACYARLRPHKPCRGCRGPDEAKPDHCRRCHIKDCAQGRGLDFCGACPAFPCPVLKRLDKSYRQRYQVSLVENGRRIATLGAQQHLWDELARWRCPACGAVVSLHDHACSECGQAH